MDINKFDKILKRVVKPARYIGTEVNSVVKNLDEVEVKFAFAFPDVYEVGMSHLGLQILYSILNKKEYIACERVFAPWVDMEEEMRKEDLPLFSLENREAIKNFDLVGFTLQYEMSYTNILNMLDLAGIPLLAADRGEDDPFILAGGPCAYNPEPLADIIDFFVIGEGEEVTLEILDKYRDFKKTGGSRKDFLREVGKIQGVYVPSFYQVAYNEDQTIRERTVMEEGMPDIIEKRIVKNMDKSYYPEELIIPYIETVHDRIVLEIFRGCTRGCRFCQAGMIYRPVREKSPERLMDLAKELVEKTGYEDISLSSLSSCDYSQLELLIAQLMDRYEEDKIGVSLPSLRLDSFSIDLLKEIEKVRKTGLTFAPEAGSQRLRDVINKGIREEDLTSAVGYAFQGGWSTVKLYFMIGLPTETREDVLGIKDLGYKVRDIFFAQPREERRGNFKVTLSTACFVPKPFTPFQWVGQDSIEEFYEKINLLRENIRDRKVVYNYHTPELSYLEAIVARGDRRVGQLLIRAWEKGCKFDGWSEFFNYDLWLEAMEETGIDGDFYALRERNLDEIFPWDFIDIGVSKEYLIREYDKANSCELTRDCREGCTACGVNQSYLGGVC